MNCRNVKKLNFNEKNIKSEKIEFKLPNSIKKKYGWS